MTRTQTPDQTRARKRGPTLATTTLKVIDGGGARIGPRHQAIVPEAPHLCVSELAADMAENYALSLLRKRGLADLDDPHCAVWIDSATHFTLHELLCDLRSLAWFDQTRSLPEIAGDAEAEQRRALRWNADGQLTLRTLFNCGVALRGTQTRVSRFWSGDHAGTVTDPVRRPPAPDAPMSVWLDWCGRHSGATLQTPPEREGAIDPGTLEDMSGGLHETPAGRPFYNAALKALAHRAALDGGLALSEPMWRGPRLLALMAEAETRARRAALDLLMSRSRLARPAVTAARMTVWLAREERGNEPTNALYRAAADELAECAPNLLYWVSRDNGTLRGCQRFDTSLFLPLAEPERQAVPPSDCASHVVVAGAMATLLKAVFDTSRRAQIQMVGTMGPAQALGEEADRMASNIALARIVSGGWHPAENIQQLRLGQAIALQVLRETLETDNRSATLDLTDFDDRPLRIEAHPRHFGRGFAQLRANGAAVPWPQEAAPPAAHLTAVV